MQGDVAVVGAGLAGLTCARELVEAGRSVVLFDKGRKAGGRLSTRRSVMTRFDHGAPLFTATSPAFIAWTDRLAQRGVLAPWSGRFVTVGREGTRPQPAAVRWVGVPRMSALPAALAEGLDVRTKVRISRLQPVAGGWELYDDEGDRVGMFGSVVVSVPAGQAAPLVEAIPEMQAAALSAPMEPCWVAMVVPSDPWIPGFDGAEFEDGPVARVISQASKPGRGAMPGWVLYARRAWSQTHWAAGAGEVVHRLSEAAGIEPDGLSFGVAHRWRYAQALGSVPGHCLWDAERRLGLCGDWCGGRGVEGAWRSAMALAARMSDAAAQTRDEAAGPRRVGPEHRTMGA
jgi:predicted NAD/FAD-dependent oxidoreductase